MSEPKSPASGLEYIDLVAELCSFSTDFGWGLATQAATASEQEDRTHNSPRPARA
ncbi:hypothetical protein [Modestobacter marinus]|uniref:hypothetical protein n=1 Tax=Modestobacter marinus TaxID=477641 RepID=UPI001C94E70F|nr:hypothetical protein [Modestobacter marinus]